MQSRRLMRDAHEQKTGVLEPPHGKVVGAKVDRATVWPRKGINSQYRPIVEDLPGFPFKCLDRNYRDRGTTICPGYLSSSKTWNTLMLPVVITGLMMLAEAAW